MPRNANAKIKKAIKNTENYNKTSERASSLSFGCPKQQMTGFGIETIMIIIH